MSAASFAELRRTHSWRPIPGCQGRFVLTDGPAATTPAALAGAGPVAGSVHFVPEAPDPVHVLTVPGGGLISFEQKDGRFVHTLCDDEGFARKLTQLGLGRWCRLG